MAIPGLLLALFHLYDEPLRILHILVEIRIVRPTRHGGSGNGKLQALVHDLTREGLSALLVGQCRGLAVESRRMGRAVGGREGNQPRLSVFPPRALPFGNAAVEFFQVMAPVRIPFEIGIFAIGAGIGSRSAALLGGRAIWICCGFLLVSFALMFIREDLEENPVIEKDLTEIRQETREINHALKQELQEEHRELKESTEPRKK